MHKGLGYCGDHYQQYRNGQTPGVRLRREIGSIRQALLEATAGASDDCMFFEGRQRRHAVWLEGEVMQVSRAAWTVRNGHAGELQVLHACNGGSGDHGCINLRHLYLGTPQDNMDDKVEAGNSTAGIAFRQGDEVHNAKLTEDAVRDARGAWIKGVNYPHPGSTRALAKRFGVSQAAMKDVLTGRSWTHVK